CVVRALTRGGPEVVASHAPRAGRKEEDLPTILAQAHALIGCRRVVELDDRSGGAEGLTVARERRRIDVRRTACGRSIEVEVHRPRVRVLQVFGPRLARRGVDPGPECDWRLPPKVVVGVGSV